MQSVGQAVNLLGSKVQSRDALNLKCNHSKRRKGCESPFVHRYENIEASSASLSTKTNIVQIGYVGEVSYRSDWTSVFETVHEGAECLVI